MCNCVYSNKTTRFIQCKKYKDLDGDCMYLVDNKECSVNHKEKQVRKPIVEVRMMTDKSEVKRAMLATQALKMKTHDMSDETYGVQLFGTHSTLEPYIFSITIDGCDERVHTHIVRHSGIGKYVSTARADLSNRKTQGNRFILLNIPAKNLIHIMEQRLCRSAWKDTIYIFSKIKELIVKLDPMLGQFLTPPCSKKDYCTEVRCGCSYLGSPKQQREYSEFKEDSKRLVEYFKKGE